VRTLGNIIDHGNMLLWICKCRFRYLSTFFSLITFTLILLYFWFYSQTQSLNLFGTRLELDQFSHKFVFSKTQLYVGSTSHLQSINCKRFVHWRVQLKFTSLFYFTALKLDPREIAMNTLRRTPYKAHNEEYEGPTGSWVTLQLRQQIHVRPLMEIGPSIF